MSEDCIVANRTINNLLCRYNLYFIPAPVTKYKSVHVCVRACVRACMRVFTVYSLLCGKEFYITIVHLHVN